MENEHWFTRDHAVVMQAAANLDTAPAYSDQLWASAEDPQHASLFLLALLTRERAEVLVNDSDREQAAYAAGYDDGLEDAGADRRDD
jgi:hypothetical protein